MMRWVQITAGVGPAECGWVVAKLAERLAEDARAQGIACQLLSQVPGDTPGTLGSVVLAFEDPPDSWLTPWIGTVQWVGTSPFRPRHKRRNWFVGVAVFDPPEETAWAAGELRFETTRASGPGGQHVNKTESAVRVVHVPTGLAAIAQDGRSQHQNRKLALARLEQLLAETSRQGAARAKEARWGEHQALERGNPIQVYEGPAFTRRPRST